MFWKTILILQCFHFILNLSFEIVSGIVSTTYLKVFLLFSLAEQIFKPTRKSTRTARTALSQARPTPPFPVFSMCETFFKFSFYSINTFS